MDRLRGSTACGCCGHRQGASHANLRGPCGTRLLEPHRTAALNVVIKLRICRPTGRAPRLWTRSADRTVNQGHRRTSCAAPRGAARPAGIRTSVLITTRPNADEVATPAGFGMFAEEAHVKWEAPASQPIALASDDGTAVAQVRAVARSGDVRCPSQLISEPLRCPTCLPPSFFASCGNCVKTTTGNGSRTTSRDFVKPCSCR